MPALPSAAPPATPLAVPLHALAPAPGGRAGAGRDPRRLRASLRSSAWEGAAAEVFGALAGGAALTGWALHLGCGAATIGLLGALPVLAQVAHLPAARLTARFGARRVALVTVAVSRQVFLPLALVPLLPLSPAAAQALLVALAVVHHALASVCTNAWTDWMGELVPARLRGRYFGRRTALCTAAGAVAALAAGALLDGAPGRLALSALCLGASAAGVASALLMARQHGGRPRPRGDRGEVAVAAVLRSPDGRRWLAWTALSGAGAGLIVPFASLYVLRDRGLGFTLLSAHLALSALARTAAAGQAGRWVDRAGGPRRVVAGATALLAASPLLWLGAAGAGPWLLLGEALTGGAATAAAGVAGLAVPLALAPPPARPAWSATFALTGALAFAAGAAAAGPLAAALPGAARLAGPLTAPFLAAAALRAAAVPVALRLRVGAPGGRR